MSDHSSLVYCMLCGRPMQFGKLIDHRRPCEYYYCKSCDFAQMFPMPSQEEIDQFYSSGRYRYITHAAEEPGPNNFHEEEERAKGWLPYLTPAKRHLDIGSSTGQVLRTIGCEVQVGVEPGPWGRTYGAFHSLEQVEGTFDLITCLHTLEHVTDPLSMLRAIKQRKAGQAAIELPRPPGWGWPHLTAFRERSILAVLEEIGMPGVVVDNSFHIKVLCQ